MMIFVLLCCQWLRQWQSVSVNQLLWHRIDTQGIVVQRDANKISWILAIWELNKQAVVGVLVYVNL